MTRVHVWGASGYAAAEAIRLIEAHPMLEVGVLESRSHEGQAVGDHFSALRTTAYRFTGAGSVVTALQPRDVVIAAGAHGEARSVLGVLLASGVRAIDLSADFRFDDSVAYGLSEWNHADIAAASLVANPGCYPTATLLATLPLARFGAPAQLIVDAKSGITGAGRTPSVGSLFAEVSGEIRAYGLKGHRHEPEIERMLSARGMAGKLTFTPHVVPIARGMLIDAYAMYDRELDAGEVAEAYREAYRGSSFVRVLAGDRTPSVPAVVGTNDAELRVDVLGNVVRAICAIDNLGKGAAGQAIQNLNIMLGYPEETGFHARATVA